MMSTETSPAKSAARRWPRIGCGCFLLWLSVLAPALPAHATPMESAVVTIRFRSAQELAPVVSPLLGPEGRISVDARTNSLVVVDTREAIGRIAALVKRLDRPPVPLRIAVRFGQERSTAVREAEVEGSVSGDGGEVPADRKNRQGLYARLRNDARNEIRSTGVSVTTMSGSPAYVRVGTRVPYRQRIGPLCRRYGGCPEAIRFYRVETGFWVTPVLAGDRIDLKIVPEIADQESGQRVRFAAASTHIAVLPGRWTELGGGQSEQSQSLREILGVSDDVRRSVFSISVKVEKIVGGGSDNEEGSR